MSTSKTELERLVELLSLEQLEINIFRGKNEGDPGSGNVFGGQVLGQALMAAYKTVPRDRIAHSLHAYFLRPGDLQKNIIYDIDRIRDGKSFTTRRVRAIQHGEAIFNMSISFQKEELGLEHSNAELPDVPKPSALEDEITIRKRLIDKIPENMRAKFLREKPIDIRPTHDDFSRWFNDKQTREPTSYYWLKAKGSLPEDISIHQAILAYASDMGLMSTSMNQHPIDYNTDGFQGASIDHAMYFHSAFRMDEWLLYATDSPRAHNSRGFNRGQVFTKDGTLVATTAQEGLMRLHKRKK